MNEQKYEHLINYLRKRKYHAEATKQEKFASRRSANDFEIDAASDTLYYVNRTAKQPRRRIVIKGEDEKIRISEECHHSPCGGHAGRDNTVSKIKEMYYWPGFHADTVTMVMYRK